MSIGGQIRRLREAAGLKASDLAAELGLDPSAVSNLERDRRHVRAEEFSTIANFLGVSQLAILEPDSLLGRLPLATRMNGTGSLSRETVMRLTAIAELHQVLSDAGHSSPAAIGELPQGPFSRWLDHAESLASWAHVQFGSAAEQSDPLTSLAMAIETRLRVDVMIESLGVEGPEGVSITDADFPFVLVNADRPRPRALFTLAHELSHILDSGGAGLHIDRDFRARTDDERLANAFAASFLMPECEIRDTIHRYGRDADSLARMLIRFGVSYEALLYRLHNLQIINSHGRDRLKTIGWTGLLANLKDVESSHRLLAGRGSRLERRPQPCLRRDASTE